LSVCSGGCRIIPSRCKHSQPRGRGVQFQIGAVLQHSITPRGRIRGRGRRRGQPVRRSFLRSLVGSSVGERSRKNKAPREGGGSLRIPDSTDSRHRRGLTQAHIAIVLHVINQPLGDTRAALASGESSHCGGSILVVRTFLGVSIILGIPVRLVAIRVTKFVEKEGERERKTPAHISGFRRMYRAKQGAKTEKENRNFFHRGTGSA
jgi:hypothetical protein